MVEVRADDDVFAGQRRIAPAQYRHHVLRGQLGRQPRVRRGRGAGDEWLEILPAASDLQRTGGAPTSVRERREMQRLETSSDVGRGAVIPSRASTAPFERGTGQVLDIPPDGGGVGSRASVTAGSRGRWRRLASGEHKWKEDQ